MHDSEHYALLVATNGPTTVRYTRENLPADEDPGWVRQDGRRLINIHGPFEVEGQHGPYERCESGWLAVKEDGEPVALTDAEYAALYEGRG